MAFAQNLSRLIGQHFSLLLLPLYLLTPAVPVALGATLVQSSLYDVPGGYRAVLFDRFSGVKPNVRPLATLLLENESQQGAVR
jgi:prohibitin 1